MGYLAIAFPINSRFYILKILFSVQNWIGSKNLGQGIFILLGLNEKLLAGLSFAGPTIFVIKPSHPHPHAWKYFTSQQWFNSYQLGRA